MYTRKSTFLAIFTFLALVSYGTNFLAAKAQSNSSVTYEIEPPPDWQQLSFADLQGVNESGAVGDEYNDLIGYDFERVWNAGDTPDRFLKLGDLENFLAPQSFTLEEIAQSTKSSETIDFDSLPLSELPLLGEQTLSSLIEAIPDLKSYSAEEIAPIEELLSQNGLFTSRQQLGQLLLFNPNLGKLELNNIDLTQYSVSSIPNLEKTNLSEFEGWQSSFVGEIPGLSEVPLDDYPNSISDTGSIIARADFIWGTSEVNRQHTISGSYLEGFSVPCEVNCANIELDDFENMGQSVQLPFEGSQWISGKYQQVLGGTGCSIGYEPTGIHPFGDTFKVVLWETYENTDTAENMIFFNFQTHCGESPYIIGPIPSPLGSIKVNDWIFVGS
ncbi:hypothetical protein, partial [Myxosarcina sp. GI1]|uniref:hypothetical protein n=1 Tax=Myxosarcina sp. GI1 TaxID=1541065 RepID=UPI00055C9E0E